MAPAIYIAFLFSCSAVLGAKLEVGVKHDEFLTAGQGREPSEEDVHFFLYTRFKNIGFFKKNETTVLTTVRNLFSIFLKIVVPNRYLPEIILKLRKVFKV